MLPIQIAGTTEFSDSSIVEVDSITFLGLEQNEEQVALIESFTQPFPMRERDKPVMDGEMNSYG